MVVNKDVIYIKKTGFKKLITSKYEIVIIPKIILQKCVRFENISIFAVHNWRGGRVVECTGLENQRTAMYRGFESLPLRKRKALSNDRAFLLCLT